MYINNETRWNSAGFIVTVRLIGTQQIKTGKIGGYKK